MNMSMKAKLALLKRTAPRPIYWLATQIVNESESTEAKLRERIHQLEQDVWFYRDKLEDVMLNRLDDKDSH